VEQHPDRPHIYLYEKTTAPLVLSYADLYQGAQKVAGGLQARGFEPTHTAAIMLPTGCDYPYSFFGILLAGGIPVRIYPPIRLSQIEEHLKRHAGILDNAVCELLMTIREAKPLAQWRITCCFFPEGIFTRIPGLPPFHIGAFKIAVDAGFPILPIFLRGSRSLLHPDSWFPRRGLVSVTIGDPIQPVGDDWQAATALRDAARRAILLHCGEPDLTAQPTVRKE
jgi:hypothetical protein